MKMKITEFLRLTTNKKKLLRVISEVHTYRPIDPDAEICIGFSPQSGRVIYHDGRHRSMIKLLGGEEFVDVRLYKHDESGFCPDEYSWCKNHFERVFGKQCPVDSVDSLISQFDKEVVCL